MTPSFHEQNAMFFINALFKQLFTSRPFAGCHRIGLCQTHRDSCVSLLSQSL